VAEKVFLASHGFCNHFCFAVTALVDHHDNHSGIPFNKVLTKSLFLQKEARLNFLLMFTMLECSNQPLS
jgi:hypothetical protein